MSPYLRLTLFGLKLAFGRLVFETVAATAQFVQEWLADPSERFLTALAAANDKAWKTLSIALAGDGWLESLKSWFVSGKQKALAEQVRAFLRSACAARPPSWVRRGRPTQRAEIRRRAGGARQGRAVGRSRLPRAKPAKTAGLGRLRR